MRCGACGAGLSTAGRDKSGKTRIRCSGHRERGDCDAPVTAYLEAVEQAVFEGLRRELRSPVVITEYVKAYHQERQRLAANVNAERGSIERRLAAVDAESERITTWLVKGIGNVERLDQRAKELMSEERALRERLAAAGAPVKVMALHPQVLARYEQQLSRLDKALGKAIGAEVMDAAAAIREIIKAVTVSRTSAGELAIEIEGKLDSLLGMKVFAGKNSDPVGGNDGSGGALQPQPPTWRLRVGRVG